MFAKALENGIRESKAVALIISPEAMNSGWVEAEYYRALSLASNNQLQLIPVLYKMVQIPGFLSDRSWVDFSNENEYDEKVRNLVWGITGEKLKFEKGIHKSYHGPSRRKIQTSKNITLIVRQIKNPFVRDLERKLRMGNAHWIQAGFSIPSNEGNFTSVYYENQIEVFRRIETSMLTFSADITNRDANLLQDSFLDMLEDNLHQVIQRVKQVEELLSGKEFELSITLSKAGKVILQDVEKVRKLVLYAPMKLLSNPGEYDQVSDDLSTEIENLAVSVEEYQRYLTTILNQSKLEKIYSS